MKRSKGQQEIAGFVLIVVLVIVGLMIFLAVSLRNPNEVSDSLEVKNLLDSILGATSACAIPNEPYYYDFEKLFKGCYENEQCTNLNKMACEYLNEGLKEVVSALLMSEATVRAYQIDLVSKDEAGEVRILRVFEGNCSGAVSSAQRNLISGGDSLIIRMKICGEN